MGAKPKKMFRWIVQALIIAALTGFVIFVLYGPTGQESSGNAGGKDPSATQPSRAANGENKPFALFEPESSSLEDGKIGYTKEQRTKAEKSEQSAKFDVALFMPKVGTTKDYLMEIRVFPNEHMIQLVYPHFGILESSSPIKTEKTPDHSSTAHLKNGTGKWLEFAHGGYHLRLRLGNTYIAIDTIDIQKRSMVKQIAESLIDMEKLKE